MSLAIGLGGFWNAFDRGNNVGERIQQNYHAKKNQNEIDDINKQAKTDFDQKVQTGEYNGDQFYDYMMKSVAPKIRDTYMQQGNYDTANNFNTWMETDQAKQGVKLFGQGYAALNNGDHSTAMTAAEKLASMRGLQDPKGTYIPGKDGNAGYFRMGFLDGEGKRQYQSIPENEFSSWFVKNANPQAAYEAEMAAASQQKKNSNELSMHAAKKAIDAQYTQAKNNLSLNDAFKLVQNNPSTMELSTEEQLEMAKKIQAQAGVVAPGLGGNVLSGQMPGSIGMQATGIINNAEQPSLHDSGNVVLRKKNTNEQYSIQKTNEAMKKPPEKPDVSEFYNRNQPKTWEEATALAKELEGKVPNDVIRWGLETFQPTNGEKGEIPKQYYESGKNNAKRDEREAMRVQGEELFGSTTGGQNRRKQKQTAMIESKQAVVEKHEQFDQTQQVMKKAKEMIVGGKTSPAQLAKALNHLGLDERQMPEDIRRYIAQATPSDQLNTPLKKAEAYQMFGMGRNGQAMGIVPKGQQVNGKPVGLGIIPIPISKPSN